MQKLFAKLTWRLAPGWQLVQSFHNEIGIDPERPTIVTPFEATARTHISTPTMNFGDLTHTMSANTLWDVRVGRFVSHRSGDLNALSPTTPSRFDRVTGVTTGATAGRRSRRSLPDDRQGDPHALPARAGRRTPVENRRTVRTRRASRDQLHSNQCQVRGQGRAAAPVRLEPSVQHRRRVPDLFDLRDRHDHAARSADDHRWRAVRPQPCDQSGSARGRCSTGARPAPSSTVSERCTPGTCGRHGWVSTTKLSADGRTMLRASYGRFFQGVFTGELEPFHPGATAGDDDRFQSRHRRLLGPARSRSIPRSTCSGIPRRARRGPTSTPSASIAPSDAG